MFINYNVLHLCINNYNMSETISFRPSKKNKTLKVDLEALAEKENRKLNNYLDTVLSDHVKSKKNG